MQLLARLRHSWDSLCFKVGRSRSCPMAGQPCSTSPVEAWLGYTMAKATATGTSSGFDMSKKYSPCGSLVVKSMPLV